MKTKFSYPLILVLLLTLAIAADVRAQDETPGPEANGINTQERNEDEEKGLLLEPEGRNSRALLRDSLSVRPAAGLQRGKSADPKKPKEETDPLNFNFLYYIIQKFKTADLLEE